MTTVYRELLYRTDQNYLEPLATTEYFRLIGMNSTSVSKSSRLWKKSWSIRDLYV